VNNLKTASSYVTGLVCSPRPPSASRSRVKLAGDRREADHSVLDGGGLI
jgi:hypothetical protein